MSESRTSIICFDPGINVGIAFRFVSGAWGTITFAKEDKNNWNVNFSKVVRLILDKRPAHVVSESWVGIQKMSDFGIETAEMLGAIRATAMVIGSSFIKQTPSARYTRVPMARDLLLERWGKRSAMFTVHEVSALAHLLTYEAHAKKKEAHA